MITETRSPVEPARNHILELRNAGVSCQRIATAANVKPGFINGIVYGDGNYARQHADADSLKRILALTEADIPEAPNHQTRLPQAAAQRRIQALHAAGFSWSILSRHIGYEHKTVSRLASDGHGQQRLADAVHTTYQELHNADPEEHGVPAHVVKKCRETAASNGWHMPSWWDLHGGIDAGVEVQPVRTRRLTVVPELPAKGWEKHSACHGEDPELFYPTSYITGPGRIQVAKAKAVCNACPVRALCLAAAINRETKSPGADGIYGATTPQERWPDNTQEVAA